MTQDANSDGLEHSNGLTPVEQPPVSSIATIEVDGRTISKLWKELFTNQGIQEAYVRSVRNGAKGRTKQECYQWLEDADVPDPSWHGSYHALIVQLAEQPTESAYWELLDQTRIMGDGHYSTEDILNTARLFQHNDETEIITFSLEYEFFKQELDRDEREDVCSLIGILSKSFDVRLVTTHFMRTWLRQNHREDLPGVLDWSDTTRPCGSIDDALEAVGHDSNEVRLLRLLAQEAGETLSYHQVRSELNVARSTVRGWVSTLSEYGLVESHGSPSDKKVSLLEAGHEFLDSIDEEFGRQITLSDSVPDTPKQNRQRRGPRPPKDGGDGPEIYRTSYMDPSHHTAAVACAGENGGISFVKDDITAYSSKDRLVSYDESKDEAVLSVHATNPLDYTVSKAVAFSSPKLLDKALPVDRLEDVIGEVPNAILRDARCIGGCSQKRLSNPEDLRDYLVSWGEDLEDYTRRLKSGDYDDRNEFVGNIVSSAQGLSGAVAHLADCAGISIVRELRVPGDVNNGKLEDLSESIAHSIKVQSRYKNFAAYRQLFENRQHKRQAAFTPVVDSKDPFGSLIGSFVIRGSGANRLRGMLTGDLETAELHEDAPEFQINTPVRTVDRSTYGIVATRVLKRRNIRPTPEAISILHGFSNPYDAGYALAQLDDEDDERSIRSDEIRYTLSKLSPEQILPEHTPTVSKIVHALLRAEKPLSQAELADRADVSTQSIRNNRDALQGLTIVSKGPLGYRINLSFSTTEERRNQVVPEFVNTEFIEAVDSFLETVLPPGRYGDPDDVGGVLFYPQDPFSLLDDPEFGKWIKLAAQLTGTGEPDTEATVSMGPSISQTAITEQKGAIA